MNPKARKHPTSVLLAAGLLAAALSGPALAANPCAGRNPCAAKNPCAAGPQIKRQDIVRPAGYQPVNSTPQLIKQGEALFKDPRLSTNGMSCNTCHQDNNAYQASFAKPYPHRVQMAKDDIDLDTIHLDEMIQLCMVKPMAAKPLPWNSSRLAALAAYVGQVQKTFKPVVAAANPCAEKKPVAKKYELFVLSCGVMTDEEWNGSPAAQVKNLPQTTQ